MFGESNEVFSPLVGGTTKDDVRTGRVARLTDPAYPGRTTVMKVATVSTLWDYINRAMPWTQPKSLKPDEVYAVTAYLLNMAGVLPDNFTLSNRNMAEVQALLPNRNGMNLNHSLWPGKGLAKGGKPDVQAVACMNNCATEATVASFLPDFARNAHGNLAEQNRLVGAQHGADTTRPAGAPAAASAAAAPTAAGNDPGPAASRLGAGRQAGLQRVPRPGEQDRRSGFPRHRQEIQWPRRFCRLSDGQDPRGRHRRVGRDSHAGADALGRGCQAARTMAGRRCEEMTGLPRHSGAG